MKIIIGIMTIVLIILAAVVVTRSHRSVSTIDKQQRENAVKSDEKSETPSTDRGSRVLLSPEKSMIAWVGRAIGKEHHGVVQIKEGNFTVLDNAIVGANVVIDMRTISDMDLSGEMQEKLVTHLKSDDFFGVEKYPEAYLVITQITNSGDAVVAQADVTIKGTSLPVTIQGDIDMSDAQAVFRGDLVIDRTLWGIEFGSEKFVKAAGATIIDDNIALKINLVSEDLAQN